jgi:glycogen phosphorylase
MPIAQRSEASKGCGCRPFDWTRASMLNIAQMAWFSSDRTIGEYAQDIWKVQFELPSNLLGREQEQAS